MSYGKSKKGSMASKGPVFDRWFGVILSHDGANDYSKRSCKGIYDRRTDHWRQCSGERND